MKRSLWIIASLLLGSWMVYSQQYQLEGRIVNEKKEALPGATVMLFANDSVVAGAACNEKGVFRIDGISAGSFLARFSSLGYKQLEQVLTVSKNLKLTDVLMEEDAQSLSEVVVSADKRDLISTKAGASTFYLSDHIRKDAQNAYEALREVPKLIVDATNRKLMMSDGSSPVILINGVNRPNYINSLDPQDIEAVEVIENPSARYRGSEDVRSVINLKIKKKKNLYTSFNIYTKQNPELIYGVSGASFEVGNSKASLFINAQQFYFNNDKRETMDNIQSGTVVRNLDGKGTYDANMVYLSMGADWLLTEKNYFSLALNILQIRVN